MDTIHRLRVALVNAFTSHGQHHSQQELFDELMVHKSRLSKVFDVGNRNPQEQKEIESGKTVIDGKSVTINQDFARQVLFLSQQLECSERYVAGLLNTIMSENPNIGPIKCIEFAITEFHQRRRYLADCLDYLFQAAQAAQSPNQSQVYTRIEIFLRTELIPPVPQQGGEITLAYRICREIEHLGDVIARADTARRGARSNTSAPSAQNAPSLGYEILNSRCDSLRYERRHLATTLFIIARLGYFSPNEVSHVIEWLSANPNHGMTYYMLTTILAVFDSVDPGSFGSKVRGMLANDKNTMTFMTKKLAPTTEWKEPGLKATILLKWTLFLTEYRHRNPSYENRDGFKTEELESQVRNAVQGDAFAYLSLAVLQLQRKQGSSSTPSLLNSLALSTEQQEQREVPVEDFKALILSEFESLVRSLITHASSELRKIKQRQEDIVLASARTDRTRTASSRFATSAGPDSEKPPRNDIAILYSFIGLLYSSLPVESALQFWGSGPQVETSNITYSQYLETTAGKLPAFLQWAVWSTQVQDTTMSMALYDMLAGLAKGQQCSELAYNFMARGTGEVIPGSNLPTSSSTGGPTVSWDVIFGILDSWAVGSPSTRPPAQPLGFGGFGGQQPQHQQQQQQQPPPIGPKEVLFAQSFLRLLSNTVTYSVAVRTTISGHVHFRAIPTLVSLIPLSIPLELKGTLFETLAAFCEPGAGVAGVEICRAVWTLMERLEIINVRAGHNIGFGAGLPSGRGVEVELEEIEAAHGLYPSTLPFLKLLATLIHTPKRSQLKDRVGDVGPVNTIPESLGQPYRLPGIGPFVSFVIDNVFSKIPSREYLRPSERWQMNDYCLCFIERAVASFDLESLLSSTETTNPKAASLTPLLVHPGYDVMKSLLTNSTLQGCILSYVVDGVEGFEKGYANDEPFFRSTIVRVLRIVLRVLEIQDIFLDVLIPLLADFDSAPIVGTIHPRSYFTRFDKALSYGPQYAPALAAYVSYPAHSELVFLSIKIISILSSSSAFPNLTTLIERSDESERILAGFIQILSAESSEDVALAESVAEQTTGAGAPDIETPTSFEQAIRLAALDLFIQNTQSDRPFPNLAHFLLFGGTSNEQQIQDPHALGARQTCIHVFLDLLNEGIPRLKGKGKDREAVPQNTPLFITLPALAERCYRVIYQLCVHPRTSEFTMRYLRTREDFFARHLAAIPSQVPETLQDPHIQVLYNDGSRVTTTVPALSSFLRSRSWIFDLVALDLHVLTNKGHHKGVAELLDILFGNEPEEPAAWEDDVLRPFREVGQSHMRIIEFVQSLTFDWSDNLDVKTVDLQLLAALDLHSCVRKDASGCEIIDRSALLEMLTAARRALHSQNTILTPALAEQLSAETTYILESCAVENHRREVVHATNTSYEAWRRLLDTTLTKCFDRLPHESRENMLFDLLHVLPPIIHSSDIQDSTAVLISEVILSSITKLREDRQHQVIIQSAGGDSDSGSLPAERLYAILRSTLECILDNNRIELVRGNLYAALINYVHLISSSTNGSSTGGNLSKSFRGEDSLLRDSLSMSLVPQSPLAASQDTKPALQSNSLSLMKSVIERLVTTIARDAIDGTEVWRTVAFMLLDSLVQLSGLERQHVVLAALVRQGVLNNFVQGVKESDILLQSVLKPDPDDLNPLYVYEAKMSLFVRMAETRGGAEKLLEAQLIPVLGQCDYLDARPEADDSFMDLDTFLPSAIQRYHQLFMPTLQLVNAMLATLGNKHATASNQALDFLSRHSATIVIMLRNDPDDISLALVEEIHLLVSLCAAVLPLVPQVELALKNSGIGSIHAAILSLSTRCLGNTQYLEKVRPQTDAEVLSASVSASGFGTETKFNATVRQKERLLRKGLIAYLGAASDFTEPQINLILSPVTATPRYESAERGAHFTATNPTLGDVLEALNDFCIDLSETLRQISDISAELGAKELIAVDNISEILRGTDTEFIQDLDIGQKRSLICRELERIKGESIAEAKIVMHATEMLLLLLWRHLTYYTTHPSNPPPNQTLTSQAGMASRFPAAPNPETLKSEVKKKIAPVLQRLESGLLDSSAPEWKANQLYVEIMCRRLRDWAGLLKEGDESDDMM